MEVDGDLEVVRIAIATGALLDGGDLGVQSFGDGVGDAMLKVVVQTSLWVGSTLSRIVCKGDVRWTAWSCTGSCLV